MRTLIESIVIAAIVFAATGATAQCPAFWSNRDSACSETPPPWISPELCPRLAGSCSPCGVCLCMTGDGLIHSFRDPAPFHCEEAAHTIELVVRNDAGIEVEADRSVILSNCALAGVYLQEAPSHPNDSDALGCFDGCDAVVEVHVDGRLQSTPLFHCDGDRSFYIGPPDSDADGVVDTVDNCPLLPNPGQDDLDDDGDGDPCDVDADGDGQLDIEVCRAQLAAHADQDGDGVADARDRCAGTLEGALVDAEGCTLAEFCARIDASDSSQRGLCVKLDWQNDEPGRIRRSERDCVIDRGGKGRADDRCVPAF